MGKQVNRMHDGSHRPEEGAVSAPGRGFVTIATGHEKYYRMAVNLLRSYRQYGNDPTPFTLLCDRDCPEAREFDSFVLIEDAKHSYLDKLSIDLYTPYEETIFLDADVLILKDTKVLWDDFSGKDDFSCYGRALTLDARDGWFWYEEMGDLKPRISFGVSMHGGLYYLKKSAKCREVFDTARYFSRNYHNYKFSIFTKPADEPVLALSMALAGIRPCSIPGRMLFLPSHDGKIRVNAGGQVLLRNKPSEALMIHFGNRYLARFLYRYLLETLDYHRNGGEGILPAKKRMAVRMRCLPEDTKAMLKRMIRKIVPEKYIRLLKKKIKK